MAKAKKQLADRDHFCAVMAKSGIEIPGDRRDGAFAAHLELDKLKSLLRAPRDAASEPSSIFSLNALLREK
jgi:hypothetical protein